MHSHLHVRQLGSADTGLDQGSGRGVCFDDVSRVVLQPTEVGTHAGFRRGRWHKRPRHATKGDQRTPGTTSKH